jgi:hypothetical protein
VNVSKVTQEEKMALPVLFDYSYLLHRTCNDFGPKTPFFNRHHFEIIVTSTLAPLSDQIFFIQNGVNIQDGDFTFVFLPFSNLINFNPDRDPNRKLYNNK